MATKSTKRHEKRLRMAKDVDVALHDVIAGQGGMTAEKAAEYVKQMKKESRYQRDVY